MGKPAAARPSIAVVFSFGAAGTRGLDAPVDPVDTNGRGKTPAAIAGAAAARGGRETDQWHRPARYNSTASAPAAGTGTRRVRPSRAEVWPCAAGATGREMGTTRQWAGARRAAARAAAAGGKAAEECVGGGGGDAPARSGTRGADKRAPDTAEATPATAAARRAQIGGATSRRKLYRDCVSRIPRAAGVDRRPQVCRIYNATAETLWVSRFGIPPNLLP